jgi:streptomycin 6-kinase
MRQEINIARRCERAVVTAYRELRQVGSDDLSAFQACTALYRIHHPEASIGEARRLVAEWIDCHLVKHQDAAESVRV